jgi:pyruvate formate lyase activating enzyme
MVIHGLQKLTLLDYPGHTACTVFTARCNWRCPFCHNASLVLRPDSQPIIGEQTFFAFLEKRRGLLDGVAVTGGEPTLNRDLPDFLARVKAMGFETKLDTNGTNPGMLREILERGLADYVAMDIKAGRDNYPAVTGTLRPGLEAVEESAGLLMASGVAHEFRTTVVRELHATEDFRDIARWLAGDEKYFLQAFKDSGDILAGDFSAFSREEMEKFRAALAPSIPRTEIRGMD